MYVYKGNKVHFLDTEANQGKGGVSWWREREVPRQRSGCDFSLS